MGNKKMSNVKNIYSCVQYIYGKGRAERNMRCLRRYWADQFFSGGEQISAFNRGMFRVCRYGLSIEFNKGSQGVNIVEKDLLTWNRYPYCCNHGITSDALQYTGRARSFAQGVRLSVVRENCDEPIPYRTGGKYSEACDSSVYRRTQSLCARC